MEFHDKLRLGKSISNTEELINQLIEGKARPDIYLICVKLSGNNLMEIFRSTEIFKSYNKTKSYKIIGISKGRQEAFETTAEIVGDYIRDNKDFTQFKAGYFMSNKIVVE